MKYLKVFAVFALLFVLLFVVNPVFAQGEGPADPPKIEQFDFLAQSLMALATMVVTFGVKFAADTWGIDISGKATQLTAAIVLMVFEFIDKLFAIVPPAYYDLLVATLGFITALLMAFGASGLWKRLLAALNKALSDIKPSLPAKVK